METKDELLQSVKEWVQIDNEINTHKAQVKLLNERKKRITTNLMQVMKTHDIECFDLKDGCISYKKSVVKKTITGKSLIQVLKNYYKNDETAEELTKYILDNREEQVKESIRRKIDK